LNLASLPSLSPPSWFLAWRPEMRFGIVG